MLFKYTIKCEYLEVLNQKHEIKSHIDSVYYSRLRIGELINLELNHIDLYTCKQSKITKQQRPFDELKIL